MLGSIIVDMHDYICKNKTGCFGVDRTRDHFWFVTNWYSPLDYTAYFDSQPSWRSEVVHTIRYLNDRLVHHVHA